MKSLLIILIILWTGLTAVGFLVVLPEERVESRTIETVWELSYVPAVQEMETDFREWVRVNEPELEAIHWSELVAVEPGSPKREAHESAFRRWYDATHERPLSDTPRLVWSTDDNPARQIQMRLFRQWHLEKYGELVDIVTDPANRDVTKMVVQSISGTGADIIESWGPQQLRGLVESGIALDLSEMARERGFEFERCFPAGWSSFVHEGKQYGFPANVGYVVLFYHKDLVGEAGITIPIGGWTIDELVESARILTVDSPDIPGGKRWGVVGMHPWPMSLVNGGRFFADDGTRSIFNSPETVEAFQAFHDLIYRHHVMPTPAETASMAAVGGFTGGNDNGLFFAAKLCAMTIGGRWEYVTYAQSNVDRVILPALQRRARIAPSEEEKARIERIIESLGRDVLQPLSGTDYELIRDSLTSGDRARLMQIGVAHQPTLDGRIKYADVGARVALVNRASPHREHAVRFIEFLASEEYNEQINQTFDSICGVVEFCADEDGIAGPPEALPGLEDFDSEVFLRAMDGAESQQLSPFIGPERQGFLAGQVMDQLMNNRLSPAEAAQLIEQRLNRQIRANVERDPALRKRWEELTGESIESSGTDGERDR